MYKYKNTEEAINATTPATFVCFGKWNTQIRENEYFALCVTDDRRTPHTIAEEPAAQDTHIVGIEKTSGKYGWYISKSYSQRATSHRGVSVVLRIDPVNLDKFCLLD